MTRQLHPTVCRSWLTVGGPVVLNALADQRGHALQPFLGQNQFRVEAEDKLPVFDAVQVEKLKLLKNT